jgi:hypothetical protein
MQESLRSPNGKKLSTWYNIPQNIPLYQLQLIAERDLLLSYLKALSVKFVVKAQLCWYARLQQSVTPTFTYPTDKVFYKLQFALPS